MSVLRKVVAASAGLVAGGVLMVGPVTTAAAGTAGSDGAATHQAVAPAVTITGVGCTGVPDQYGKANFAPACAAHDACYSAGSPRSRLDCDNALNKDLVTACRNAYVPTDPARFDCEGRADIYYNGVRKLGRPHYEGAGDPA